MTKYSKSTLIVSGADAKTFLQGQLTCDMDKVSASKSNLGAYCNAQGRMLAIFQIRKHSDDYWLTLPTEISEPTMDVLKKYAIFSKVTLEIVPNEPKIESDWRLQAIKNKTPNIFLATMEKFTPQMLNLDKLGAVSLTKGCFIGQEIIARTQHLGTLKRHLHQFRLDSNPPPKAGDEIHTQDQRQAGIVVDAECENRNRIIGLAVIQDQYIETVLSINNQKIVTI